MPEFLPDELWQATRSRPDDAPQAVLYADAVIDAYAEVYDTLLFPGVGDILRVAWRELRPWLIPVVCDCTGVYHRWNCAATPIWAQTIRDLDVNPWTVVTNAQAAIHD